MKTKRLLLSILFLLYTASSFAASKQNEIRFLALADIHFDPFVACYASNPPCPLISALEQAPASQWAHILASKDPNPSKYREDTNYSLFVFTLNKAKIAAENKQVQFVLIMGDFLGHDYRSYFKKYSAHYTRTAYRSFVKKTMEFLNGELAQTFPGLDVYSVVGNNDSYTSDYGYYPKSEFFSDVASLWSSLIKNKNNRVVMRQQFSNAGYYAVNLTPKLKLLVLNSVLFSTKANGKGVGEAANVELDWFEQELKTAQLNKQKVLIAMHIPPGIDIYASLKFRLFRMIELWGLPDIERYEALLKTYAPQIMGIFAGHLHYNLLQALSLGNEKSVPMAGVPSVSPFFGNNPGFNIYIFSGDSFDLEKVDDYNYPLTQTMPALN